MHRTNIGSPFELRLLASAPSAGGSGGVGRSMLVGWVGDGIFTLTLSNHHNYNHKVEDVVHARAEFHQFREKSKKIIGEI